MADPSEVVIRWEEPPSVSERHAGAAFRSNDLADALRARPGQWAVVAENYPSSNLATIISGGYRAAFRPAGEFEATQRTVGGVRTVYARYIREEADRGCA